MTASSKGQTVTNCTTRPAIPTSAQGSGGDTDQIGHGDLMNAVLVPKRAEHFISQ